MTKQINEDVSKPTAYRVVSRVMYGEEETADTTPLEVPNFVGPTAQVTVGAAFTKNLGNYQSARINVEVSMPCYPVDEEIVRVADHVSQLVNALLEEQVASVG